MSDPRGKPQQRRSTGAKNKRSSKAETDLKSPPPPPRALQGSNSAFNAKMLSDDGKTLNSKQRSTKGNSALPSSNAATMPLKRTHESNEEPRRPSKVVIKPAPLDFDGDSYNFDGSYNFDDVGYNPTSPSPNISPKTLPKPKRFATPAQQQQQQHQTPYTTAKRGDFVSPTNPEYVELPNGERIRNPFFETLPGPEVWYPDMRPETWVFGETALMAQYMSRGIEEDLAMGT